MSEFVPLVVIVPTRNRASLAVRTIDTLLQNANPQLTVLVSDNSTEEPEVSALAEFCRSKRQPKLHYIRPPEPLGMAPHWEWAVNQALNKFTANHFTVVTDRFLVRKNGINELASIARKYPDKAIVYRMDSVYDQVTPCFVERSRWTGSIFQIKTADILAANAKGENYDLTPVFLNSIATRQIITDIQAKYGDFCVSIAPDFYSGFKTLGHVDDILLYDKPLTINWGRARSNGLSYARGVTTKDSKSFAEGQGGTLIYPATPIPEITVIINAIMHEYLAVKNKNKSTKFVEIDQEAYFVKMADHISWLENNELRERYTYLLDQYAGRHIEPSGTRAFWKPGTISQEGLSLLDRFKNLIGNNTRPLWWFLHRRLGMKLPNRYRTMFPDSEQAMYFAIHKPLMSTRDLDHLPLWARNKSSSNV